MKKATSSDGMGMKESTEKKGDMRARVKELQTQVDDLKELVNTLLSIIAVSYTHLTLPTKLEV